MLLEVAMALGPSFADVADQPWRYTLYLYYRIIDRERIRALTGRKREVDRAVLTSLAFNEPNRLDSERRDVLSDMRAPPGDVRGARRRAVAELEARGRALAAKLERERVFIEGEPVSRVIVSGTTGSAP